MASDHAKNHLSKVIAKIKDLRKDFEYILKNYSFDPDEIEELKLQINNIDIAISDLEEILEGMKTTR